MTYRIVLYLAFLALPIVFVSCRSGAGSKNETGATDSNAVSTGGDPEWNLQSNIYEVNLRQYGSSNSFKGFEGELPRLKEMGVEILWFMPITPISVKDRKGKLGSYYAVQNYRAVNPEYGTMEDWKSLVKAAQGSGFKVITDWVPNHTGGDHPWLVTHPEFYEKDSTGKVIAPFDWTDVRKLDYSNREMRDSMIASMKFWIDSTGLDGFRCDVAGEVPNDFWKECISTLRKSKQLFMLAEADKPELHTVGFDATYAWTIANVLYGIKSGKTDLKRLDFVIDSVEKLLTPDAMRMYFTTNHDENSWNGTEFERFGEGYKTFAVFTQTMKRSIPLIYSGQEEPNKKRIKFFETDPIEFGKYELAPFYRKLLKFRRASPALAADASFRKVNVGNEKQLYAYEREKNGERVLVILNFSAKEAKITLNEDVHVGNPLNLFMGVNEEIKKGHSFNVEPWGWVIYHYKK